MRALAALESCPLLPHVSLTEPLAPLVLLSSFSGQQMCSLCLVPPAPFNSCSGQQRNKSSGLKETTQSHIHHGHLVFELQKFNTQVPLNSFPALCCFWFLFFCCCCGRLSFCRWRNGCEINREAFCTMLYIKIIMCHSCLFNISINK